MSKKVITGREPGSGRCLDITIHGENIEAIEASNETSDLWISAGLVDLQVNGYGGLDCNDNAATPATIKQLTQAMIALGVTTFAPTIITASEHDILNRLGTIAEARARDAASQACIPFIHVEGPHISPLEGYRGAHREDHVRPPSLAEFERWQQACAGLVGLITLSPHFAGSDEYIAAVVAGGVHVSIGHSHATHEQIGRAIDAGARLSTHLGNGIAPVLQRHPNPIWSQLADDRLSACFIADGHHLPAETLKAMVRAKGLDRSILVSDTVALAGMAPGHYTAPVGGQVELSTDGRLSIEGTQTLAGSAIPLIECLGRAVRMTARPLAEILSMATENPGKFAGNVGRLYVGARADIIRFRCTDRVAIEEVWLAGELAYRSSGPAMT